MFGIFARILFPMIGDEPVGIRWKYATAQFAYEISPFIILFGLKVLFVFILDFFRFDEKEKTIILHYYTDEYNFIFYKKAYTILVEKSRFGVIRMIATLIRIIEPIWLDKRITNVDCQVAHTYQIKMLRFSHLIVEISEITNNHALKEQLDNALALIEQQQEEIEICQEEIRAQQRKYAIQHQKYMDAEDEQKKEVHFCMMQDIEKEIDKLNEEKEKHKDALNSYQLQKKELEQMIATEEFDL